MYLENDLIFRSPFIGNYSFLICFFPVDFLKNSMINTVLNLISTLEHNLNCSVENNHLT